MKEIEATNLWESNGVGEKQYSEEWGKQKGKMMWQYYNFKN